MTFDMSKGSFKYTLEEIFNNTPTKLEIENKFYDRMVRLNKANKLLFKKKMIDEEFEPRFIIMEGNQEFMIWANNIRIEKQARVLRVFYKDAKQDKGVWSEFAEEGLGLTDKELSDVDTMLQLENEMEIGK